MVLGTQMDPKSPTPTFVSSSEISERNILLGNVTPLFERVRKPKQCTFKVNPLRAKTNYELH